MRPSAVLLALSAPLVAAASTGQPASNDSDPSAGHVFTDMKGALHVMQDTWFQLWQGTWTTAIDWTAAILNTQVTSTLMALSEAQPDQKSSGDEDMKEEINTFFAQSTAYYFGENATAIRNHAFDDMLWVVLGWLKSVRFIDTHSDPSETVPWHGAQFVPVFAHRVRLFYDLARKGWGTDLCGGGMNWNPELKPYKNAITNQLYISASIGMYLDFPGDANTSPYLTPNTDPVADGDNTTWPAHDPRYLTAAVDAYNWLNKSNMTDAQGLYVDGFHITGYESANDTGTGKCDERNEMVYTYNQGVILSGLRRLYLATADDRYLTDGHSLVRNVVSATGYRSPSQADGSGGGSGGGGHVDNRTLWSGLGGGGILEDYCDSQGTCNQDGQTFKGIFFMHLTDFCQPLTGDRASDQQADLHRNSCRSYAAWVEGNARAALRTRDASGRMGMWWNADLAGASSSSSSSSSSLTSLLSVQRVRLPVGAIDYRNRVELLSDPLWSWNGRGAGGGSRRRNVVAGLLRSRRRRDDAAPPIGGDLNDRGRGRTVESHSGGLAVVRAAWEFARL